MKKNAKVKTQEAVLAYEIQHISDSLSNNQIHIKFPQLQGMREALHVQEKKASISYLLDVPRKHKHSLKQSSKHSEKKMKYEQLSPSDSESKPAKFEGEVSKEERRRKQEGELAGWTIQKW